VNRALHACVIAGLLLIHHPSFAAEQCERADQDRPRVGLVLGGGGARGSAHIGVIQVLEEMQVPVDYVVGTSIGSLVGGLYATGMNGEELQEVMLGIDWSRLFVDETGREDWPMRRKINDARYLFGPRFGIGKDSSLMPQGMISGQQINFLFEGLVKRRVDAKDFDELPIPFRAIAADIVSGDEVVIGEGDLPLAMRSSMAIPAVFDPVEWGEQLLVDGGIVNNVPIDVTRAMGADVLIVVDVGSPLRTKDEIGSVLGIVDQLSGLLIKYNVDRQIASLTDADLLLRPPLGKEVTTADFAKAADGIAIGYAAADTVRSKLARYSISDSDYRAHRAAIDKCVRAQPDTIDFVRLDNQSRFDDEVIRARITAEPGQVWDKQALERDIQQVYALGFIEQARYEVSDEDGETGLVLHVRQDLRGSQILETGLDISGDGTSNAVNFRLGYLDTDFDRYGSELRVTGQIGEEPGLSADLYKYLGPEQRYFVQPVIFAHRLKLGQFNEDGDTLAVVNVDQFGGSLALGREFGNSMALLAGIRRASGTLDTAIGIPGDVDIDFDSGEYFVGGLYDRLDSAFFATSGSAISVRYSRSDENLGADEEYEQIQIDAGGAFGFGRHALEGVARYYETLDGIAPVYGEFRAGGLGALSGFNDNEISAQNFGMLLGGYRYRLSKSPSALIPGYLGLTAEYGGVAGRGSEVLDNAIWNGSIYLGYDTPVGPMYFGWGMAEAGRDRIFLRLGSAFGGNRAF